MILAERHPSPPGGLPIEPPLAEDRELLVHVLSGGRADDGDPRPYAESIKQLATTDGNALVLTFHYSEINADFFIFPAESQVMPDESARLLFAIASRMPDVFRERAAMDHFDVARTSRLMAFNADCTAVLRFSESPGTRPCTLR